LEVSGMFYGIAYLGSYKFSMIMKLEPVFTTIFGIVLVNDVLDNVQYAGIALVLFSLIALQLFDKQN
jgi:drug/metabolite transporter (DMT)-like permease